MRWFVSAVLCMLLVCWCIGCSDAEQAKIAGYGNKHHVTLYSGGEAVQKWTTTGKVSSEGQSDGYYFMDEKTGHLIEVSGNVVIEMLDE